MRGWLLFVVCHLVLSLLRCCFLCLVFLDLVFDVCVLVGGGLWLVVGGLCWLLVVGCIS